MVEEAYVSFETAKLLKEKGFDTPVWTRYENDDNDVIFGDKYNWNNSPMGQTSAPTIQMAMRWLREVHNVMISPYALSLGYYFEIFDLSNRDITGCNPLYKIGIPNKEDILSTYEKACEAAIKYYLEHLPELKESEDEKIRKTLIDYFDDANKADENPLQIYGIHTDKAIAWLEKQGEQKSVIEMKSPEESLGISSEEYNKIVNGCLYDDKIKPKFHEGDTMRTWKEANDGYTDGMPVVVSIDDEFYHCTNELIAIKDQDNYEFPPINVKQRPDDKVESKFHKGNWYQCTKDFFGKGVTFDKNTAYYCAQDGCLQCEYGCHIAIVKDLYDNFKLWTIEDAKDGDVLTTSNYIYIFNSIDKETETVSFYCLMKKSDGHFSFGDYKIHDEILNSTPATKEQRDLLFSKMKEAGYEWNAEKKELKEIGPKFHEGQWITNGEYTWKIVKVNPLDYTLQSQDGNIVDDSISYVDEQFHFFNIEDDAKKGDILRHNGCTFIFICIENDIVKGFEENLCNGTETCSLGKPCEYNDYHPATKKQKEILFKTMKESGYEWDAEKKELKEIKKKPAEWSEEDERVRKRIVGILEGWMSTFKETSYAEDCKRGIEWLKSIKPQKQWKPSEEQMKVLISEVEAWTKGCPKQKVLESLYNDLKKLK